MRARTVLLVCAAAASLALLTPACATGDGTVRPVGAPRGLDGGGPTSPPQRGTLEWEACDDYDIDVPDGADQLQGADDLGCARLAVPLDRAEPNGASVAMAVAMLPATGSDDERLGSLIVNPGGPGGSGLSMVAMGTLSFPTELRRRWDIVGFDPRGLGASDSLDCLPEERRAELATEDAPDDPAAASAEAERTEAELAAGCRDDDADLLERMGTSWVVDDVEELRVALGDEPLHYLGLSYGTRIGALYATRYPDRVGSMVLDGAVSPDRSLRTLPLGQATGIRRAYESFLAACAARVDCPLGADPTATVQQVLERLEAEPVTYDGPDGDEELDRDRFVTGVITSLYDATGAVPTAEAVAALVGTDDARRRLGASFLGGLADQQDGRRSDGRYGNGFEVQAVVTCADAAAALTSAEGDALRDEMAAAGGVLAADSGSGGSACASLPVGRGDTTIAASTAVARVLVVGTAGDPATPVEWAAELAGALGGAPLLRYEGAGHTASLSAACVTERVAAFLAEPTSGVDTTPCAADPDAADLFLAVGKQIVAMGLPEETASCVADALRTTVDPLALVAEADEPDPDIIDAVQTATMRCARGG